MENEASAAGAGKHDSSCASLPWQDAQRQRVHSTKKTEPTIEGGRNSGY